MSPNDLALWLFALGILLLALCASAQASLVYIDRARLRHMLDEGASRAQALTHLLDEPSSTFSAVLVVYTVAAGLASAGAFWTAQQWWVSTTPWVAILVLVVAAIIAVVAQFVGRLVAVSRPERVALAFVKPVGAITLVLGFILVPLMGLDRLVGGMLGVHRANTPADAEERLRHLVEDNADLEEDEREMIASVIELGDQPVREVMVPRMDIAAQPITATIREVLDLIVVTGHSRIPMFDDTIDNITGVVYAKDVLKHLRDGSQTDIAARLAREPYFVPETKKVDELLHEMQARRVHLAIVLDEYGGTAGLISIEDLIEEIVGEIQDEYDVEEAPIEVLSDTEAVFDGRVSIRDVNDTLDLELDDDDFDTLGGLVYHQLGKVPAVGDQVRVDGVVALVLSTAGRRVKKVRVSKVAHGPVESPAPEPPDTVNRDQA